MKTAIVGCGLNSDYHIRFVKSYPNSEIVGIVDSDLKKARECAERHAIPGIFPNLDDLIKHGKPDVVHIVTPPHTHYSLAKSALEKKCHVLLEKPVALNLQEATELFETAERHGVKLCAMHNHFFDPCMARAHELVQRGDVGEIMNVESYYGLNTDIPAFRAYPTPNRLPWLYTLPGGVYHDFMAHPLYVLLEYTGRPLEVSVLKKSHGVLPQNMPDELKIIINGEKAFGTVTFSFAAKPHLHFVRIYGNKMMVEVDFNTMTTVTHPISSLPKAAQKATYNLSASRQLATSTVTNVINFVRGKLKPYQGMEILIHRFYDSITGSGEIPVTRDQAIMVIEAMDEIWKQLQPKPLLFAPMVPDPSYTVRYREKVLVTGGTGFLGKRLVKGLVSEGYPVRVLARKLSNIEPLKKMGVEIFYGDVADRESLDAASAGIDLVVHAAAGTSGTKKDSEEGTIQGTRNILALCERQKMRKLVYISSCSVYGIAGCRPHETITETSAMEPYPLKRGYYSASKQEAEGMVIEAMKKNIVSAVVLRPGTIYGPGGEYFSPMMGFSVFKKIFVVIGGGGFKLPLVYIDNLVEAILKSIGSSAGDNQVFNVVDAERMNKRQYMRKLVKKLYPKSLTLYFPYTLLYLITSMQEWALTRLDKRPFLTRYRLESSQKSISYDSSKIMRLLNWSPRITPDEAISAILKYEKRGELSSSSPRSESLLPPVLSGKP